MTDCFALFGLARRPWLDTDIIKERFHRLTAEHHPDVNAGSEVDFPEVIAAYNILRDPKTRLRHLLELESPESMPDAKAVPADLVDLFMRIATARTAFGKIATKLDAANAPLALALLAGERIDALKELKDISETLRQKENSFLEQLRQLDAQWPDARQPTLAPLAQILQQLSFLFKWSDQTREAILRLNA